MNTACTTPSLLILLGICCACSGAQAQENIHRTDHNGKIAIDDSGFCRPRHSIEELAPTAARNAAAQSWADACNRPPSKIMAWFEIPTQVASKITLAADDLFYSGSPRLNRTGEKMLSQFASKIRKEAWADILIVCHEGVRDAGALSGERATAVKQYLIDRGANGSHIFSQGGSERLADQEYFGTSTNKHARHCGLIDIEIIGRM